MKAIFHHAVQETPAISTYFFKPEKPIDFIAGQFIEMVIAHEEPDNRGSKRWFTISSPPGQDKFSITTRIMADGGSTFKQALYTLEPGSTVTISQAMGDFVMPRLTTTPLIFVAGGIGITPFLSMLQSMSGEQEARPVQLIQAIKTEDDIAFQGIFEAAHQHATLVVSDPTPSWGGERGRISAEMLLGLTKPTADSQIYVSGPEQMVESLMTQLKASGVSSHQLIGDYFPNYGD